MAIQTSFTEKVAGAEDCTHRFLALLGNDRELDLALLDVKNRVRDLSLRKNNLILSIFGYRFSFALDRALEAQATFFRAWRTAVRARWSWRSSVRPVGLVIRLNGEQSKRWPQVRDICAVLVSSY